MHINLLPVPVYTKELIEHGIYKPKAMIFIGNAQLWRPHKSTCTYADRSCH